MGCGTFGEFRVGRGHATAHAPRVGPTLDSLFTKKSEALQKLFHEISPVQKIMKFCALF